MPAQQHEVVSLLAATAVFKDVPLSALEACSHLWTLREYEADTALWWHGELATSLAVVLKGAMSAHIAGEEVGQIRAGELVGESAAFFRDRRTATVSSLSDCAIALLTRPNLIELRLKHPDVYDRLLEAALHQAAVRVRETDLRIARLAEGEPDRKRKGEPAPLARFLKRLRKPFLDKPPSVILSLRSCPVFYSEKDDILQAIGRSMTPRHLEPDEPVFQEGDPGDSVFVVADGCVQVLRSVGVGKTEPLADLFPGALFGTGSLLLRERRNATCASAPDTPSWVYEMDGRSHSRLGGKPGRRWREALLSALWFQLNRADEQLVRLKRGGEKVEKTDYQLIRAGLVATNGTDKVRTPWELSEPDPDKGS